MTETTNKHLIPRHVAIVMDGNGRWAKARNEARHAGHKAGLKSVRKAVEFCIEAGIEVLTLFAFSSENWRRPEKEVGLLMELFLFALRMEVKRLKANNVRLTMIGDRRAFSKKLQQNMLEAEQATADGHALTLQIAANYGGRWDITQAVQKLAQQVKQGELKAEEINEANIAQNLSFSHLPEPDLFIRTGGEQRISNFILWQSAYSEFYFCDTYWPDFDQTAFQLALASYAKRQRRFGQTSEQVQS